MIAKMGLLKDYDDNNEAAAGLGGRVGGFVQAIRQFQGDIKDDQNDELVEQLHRFLGWVTFRSSILGFTLTVPL